MTFAALNGILSGLLCVKLVFYAQFCYTALF